MSALHAGARAARRLPRCPRTPADRRPPLPAPSATCPAPWPYAFALTTRDRRPAPARVRRAQILNDVPVVRFERAQIHARHGRADHIRDRTLSADAYSQRSASERIHASRRARVGTQHASSATAANSRPATASVSGSAGLTSNRNDCSTRDNATAATMPARHAAAGDQAATPRRARATQISRRPAPTAARIAISFRRAATDDATARRKMPTSVSALATAGKADEQPHRERPRRQRLAADVVERAHVLDRDRRIDGAQLAGVRPPSPRADRHAGSATPTTRSPGCAEFRQSRSSLHSAPAAWPGRRFAAVGDHADDPRTTARCAHAHPCDAHAVWLPPPGSSDRPSPC